MSFRFLLSGYDTIECSYWLAPEIGGGLDFVRLALAKEEIRASGARRPQPIRIGSEEFLLASHGTGSGYPFLLENDAFSIQCGEFNQPNFFVTYRSFALWHEGAAELHRRFLAWASSVGMKPYREETLSRVDFTFDYWIDTIDFDEDSFVSLADKDNKHRKNRKAQTIRLGSGDPLMLRAYNKCDEIIEKSAKSWFYPLWGGIEENIWRFEFQARKEILKRFGIRSYQDLADRQGDILRYLANEHTTLRIKSDDSNRSRWQLHPVWIDLQQQIGMLEATGIVRECNRPALIDERIARIGASMYGYMKQLGALHAIKQGHAEVGLEEAKEQLDLILNRLHDPLAWECGVQRRINEIRLGQW